MKLPSTVCTPCGLAAAAKAGIKLSDNHIATYYPGTCDVCGKKTAVTEARDFGHPWSKMARAKKK